MEKRKGIIKFYETVENFLFTDRAIIPTHNDKKELHKLNLAYELAKLKHYDQFRDGGDRYFEHVKEVALILADEFKDYITIDTVIIAILHDSMEDTDITYDVINNLFGETVANSIRKLSKLDLLNMTSTSPEEYNKLSGEIKRELKELRNKLYFEHMVDLSENELAIKFSDRIHNLRTLDGCSTDKILRKIQETENYFMSKKMIAKFPIGVSKIEQEINILKKQY